MERNLPNQNVPTSHIVRINAPIAQGAQMGQAGQPNVFGQPAQAAMVAVNGGITLVSPGVRVSEQGSYLAQDYAQPSQPSQQIGASGGATQRQRRLQVDDALSYLEQVRQQFSIQPDVYNDFLEVMKQVSGGSRFPSKCQVERSFSSKRMILTHKE